MKEPGGVGITVRETQDEREMRVEAVTERWSRGRGRALEDLFTESEMQEVRRTNVSGRDGKRERWELGWGGTKKGRRVTEKRGGTLEETGPG